MKNDEGWRLLTNAQRAATEVVIARECARRDHLVVALSGAHAYGFPSPDSDVDLKCVHIEPTAQLVGLQRGSSTPAFIEYVDGVEMDYSSNEIGDVLLGVLKGNGNYLERIIGHAPLFANEALAPLRPIVTRALSRRVHRHYRGFAHSQLQAFDAKPSAKKLLYVLRTALTGTHLLRTGVLAIDLTTVVDEYGFADARELVLAKQRGENVLLDDSMQTRWRREALRAFELLDAAESSSSALPESPVNESELETWLIELRRARW